MESIISKYAKKALRTIAFGYKDLKKNEGGANHENRPAGTKIYEIEEGGFTLICIAGIKDIIRKEVPDAIKMCNSAGIRVRMITGDNLTTAIAIAKESGIIVEGEELEKYTAMEGPEFAKFVGGLVDKKTKEPIEVMGKKSEAE